MNLKLVKYEILTALLKVTGKHGVIMEYEAWVKALTKIADEEQTNPVARRYLLKQIARINRRLNKTDLMH